MLDLIPQVMEAWKTQRVDLEKIGEEVAQRLIELEARAPEKELDKNVLAAAYEQLASRFDAINGGFGGAPKFPMPHQLLFLLRYWKRTGDKKALSMVEKTLLAIRFGGVFDQIGFGVHRYSTDAQWIIPHFEKMLYDQALLSLAYTEAYQATGKIAFKKAAEEIFEFVFRELVSPQGGFYSAEDADSEGEEGKFYLWTENEIRQALPPEDADLAIQLFNVKAQGNYDEPNAVGTGKNILHLTLPLERLVKEADLTVNEPRLGDIKKALFVAREKRGHPLKDDKILVDWNGLMIAALARASVVFNEAKYLQAAIKASDFILQNMTDNKGVLFHRFAKGEKAVEGFLDDYAFLIFGLIEVYEACFEEKYLQKSLVLAKTFIEKFWDKTNGGFYFSPETSKETIPRMKQAYDNAIPSGTSIALLNLLRLARISNESNLEGYADRIVKVFFRDVESHPTAFTFFLCGVDFAVGPAFSVVLVGEINEVDTLDMLRVLRKNFQPNSIISLMHESKQVIGTSYKKIDGKATAYICRDKTCLPPTNSTEQMEAFLS